ncbi:MAG TPA: (d)CMP kinase [Pirellulales bacterium]|jgi:cytidylate kinase|nr:(d)CMP kinase [Pirellulales bacterium]
MIVAIDGPAGAGKSSAARSLARRLGFRFLDTGAMYRAVTLSALRRQLSWDDPQALAELARQIDIELRNDQVLLDGEDVTREIRSLNITSLIHYAADNAGVRARLVELQRQAASGIDVVSEGRDQGTVVFPEAECKIFLNATAEERARRRIQDLEARGEHLPFDEVLRQQNLRDERDRQRPVGPLLRASDAIEINTDGLSPQEVVDRLEHAVRSRMPTR